MSLYNTMDLYNTDAAIGPRDVVEIQDQKKKKIHTSRQCATRLSNSVINSGRKSLATNTKWPRQGYPGEPRRQMPQLCFVSPGSLQALQCGPMHSPPASPSDSIGTPQSQGSYPKNSIMNDVRIHLALYLAVLCLVQEASTFMLDLSPAKFARERYERSRNKTTVRTFTPVPNYVLAVDFVALVNRHGYPGEEHLVTTADGYLLRIHRIPGSPSRPRAVGKPVIYMQHGLLASSDTWVLMGPERDLAYILADAGYDVWLGNVRGNTYSRAHVSLSPDYDPAFWEFSYHEIALYDVTAVIDYILIKTAQRSLVYIGHSMGTTISYILLSTKPEYNKKIRLLVSLAPVAFWHAPPRAFVRFLIDNTQAIKSFVTNARIYELFPLTAANAQLAKTTCSDGSIFQHLCVNFVYYASGYNPDQLNASEVSYVLSYFPAGTSAQTLIHFSQNMRTGDFQMYDHGIIRNLATYKQRQPPIYNLSNVISPVGLFYGKGDALVSPGNPIELSQKLPNVLTIEAVPDEKFSHLDFLWSTDIRKLLNDRIFEFISKTLRQQSSAL